MDEEILHNLFGCTSTIGTEEKAREGQECEEEENIVLRMGKMRCQIPFLIHLQDLWLCTLDRKWAMSKVRQKIDMLQRPANCPSLMVLQTKKESEHGQRKVYVKFTMTQWLVTKTVIALPFGEKN